jgi:hypothetical protein
MRHDQHLQKLTLDDPYETLGLFAPECALVENGDDLRTIQGYLGHRVRKDTAICTRMAAKRLERLRH